MLRKVIDRPVLATVISVFFVILGIIGLLRLPITSFPDISPTTVEVSGSYPGGNCETILRSVVTPLEEQINGVENMQYIKSTAGNDGSFSISIVFNSGTNPDQAAVNVQNRVQQATSVLPQEVIRGGLTTSKRQNSTIVIYNIFTNDNSKYDELFLQNYISINLIPQIKRVPGVGQVQLYGMKDYSMRVWLNPSKLAAQKLNPADVINSINNQSFESAPGALGVESNAALEYVIRYKGKKNLPEEYENIIVKADGYRIVRLKDVARIEFGSISYGSDTKLNGKNAVSLGILQTSGSNAYEVEKGVKAEIEKASKQFPPGISYSTLMSTKEKLDESTSQIKSTLIEAFLLVFIVVFIFLQDFRSTIIPAIAVPVAIIGTFFILLVLGFTINMLTLFALVLAIGIVVDDAIVVVEAVHSKMEHTGLSGRESTHKAMAEITGAIISITLVMAAVFIPIGFMTGSSAIFYKQFAYTLATAIIISAVNALTLTPALCAMLLINNYSSQNGSTIKNSGFRSRFFTAFNAGFESIVSRYIAGIKLLAGNKIAAAGIIITIITVALLLMINTPTSLVPMEDDGFIVYSITMPPGTGVNRTTEVTNKVNKLLDSVESIQDNNSITGFSILGNGAGSPYAMGFIKLKDKKNRGRVKEIDSVFSIISDKLSSVKEGTILALRNSPVEGYGMGSGVEFELQDRGGKSFALLKETADSLINNILKQPGVGSAYSTFRADYPQLELQVDEEKVIQAGVDVSNLLNAVQTYFSGDQSLNFSRFGKFYTVSVKADGIFRMDESAFNEIFVRNDKGEMVPVKTLVTLKKIYGPESVGRYNLYNSVSISVTPGQGLSNGALIEKLENTALKKLPSGYSYEWTGLSLEEKSIGSQTIGIILMCILFVYFLLAAQYESYLLPLAVLFSIPTGLLGAFLGVHLAGLDNNIYVQVGLIMLIGLLAKNAILIVEFAIQRRKLGMSVIEAAIDGTKVRLRPIIMTSLAFIAGLIPLMFTSGSAATGNKSIGVSASAGMLSGVVLGVLITPLLFMLFQSLQEKVSKKIII